MFKVNNRNTRTRCQICSKLTIKTPEWPHWRRSDVFVNFEHISIVNFEQVDAGWVVSLALMLSVTQLEQFHFTQKSRAKQFRNIIRKVWTTTSWNEQGSGELYLSNKTYLFPRYFGYAWDCWYLSSSTWNHVTCNWITWTVPFRSNVDNSFCRLCEQVVAK